MLLCHALEPQLRAWREEHRKRERNTNINQNRRAIYNDTAEELKESEAFKAEKQKKVAAEARKVAQENYAQLVDEFEQTSANKV